MKYCYRDQSKLFVYERNLKLISTKKDGVANYIDKIDQTWRYKRYIQREKIYIYDQKDWEIENVTKQSMHFLIECIHK